MDFIPLDCKDATDVTHLVLIRVKQLLVAPIISHYVLNVGIIGLTSVVFGSTATFMLFGQIEIREGPLFPAVIC